MNTSNKFLLFDQSSRRVKRGKRLFISGLREMDTTKNYYLTQLNNEVTYGNVGDYIPGEAMHFDYYTTLDGVMLKEDPSNEEFIIQKTKRFI